MESKLQLTQEELGAIESALQETITVLKNRFRDEPQYVHPAKMYEELYDKLKSWSEPLPVSVFTLSAAKDESA